ncbi:transglutaminase-like domain-containing protein [Jannaschia sp. CCS1]|uniref:transglutaminase-like domain-containing protein n=1 Tax=Jannaschia sp. (strain CCS1) TaxID=290400 RepID=UPI000053CC84|nr:transglutaminase family protein [Jannaschia sp. CCS1]ABD56160.1 transglutaminase-like protein [Jannaschia sp. CCS1]
MQLDIEVDLDGTLIPGDAALLMIEMASGAGQRVVTSDLAVSQGMLKRLDGTAMVWVDAPEGALSLRYRATVEMSGPAAALDQLASAPLQALPGEVLPYLRPSRYCQADLFTDFTEQQFGTLDGGLKIQAIRNWIAEHVTYTSGSSDGATTAVETFAALKGVCRDFAHLTCTLARASGIPARYVSVYGADVAPQDFHAIAEVWLDGGWHPVDATDMGAPHEMAVIATGRDAADTAFMETAGWASLTRQNVRVRRV